MQGKSTLSNHLVGQERSLTGPEPGLTRDVVRGSFTWGAYHIALQDTAGRMRRSRLQLYDDAEWAPRRRRPPPPAGRSECVSSPVGHSPFSMRMSAGWQNLARKDR